MNISEFGSRKYEIEQAYSAASELCSRLAHIGIDKPELVDLQRILREEDASLGSAIAERKALINRYVKAYLKRTMYEIPAELTSIRRDTKGGAEKLAEQRESMLKAGVPSSDIMRLLPDFDPEQLKSKMTELETEYKQWERFNKSGLPEDLPANADEVNARTLK
jgi:hypothetical protein